MIFRRRRKTDTDGSEDTELLEDQTAAEQAADETTDRAADEGTDDAADGPPPAGEPDFADLDARDWRADGPFDISEVDLDVEPDSGYPRIDLGSMIITGLPDSELRLQVAEGTTTIISAMLVRGDSALELGAYAAPRSGGLWPELREELTAAATEAGGSVSLVEGPFGVELRRLLPVQAADGQQGYQPSRMWVVEGPRWMLRGILYGQAALVEGTEPPVADLLNAFRNVVVRRDDQAMAPGDLLTLTLPQGIEPAEDAGA